MSSILGSSPSLVVNSSILSSAGAANTSNGTTIAVPPANSTAQIMQSQPSEAQQMLQTFWQNQLEETQQTTASSFKIQELPLARIKKIMKMDDDVKMISAEAPLLFAKAAQMFITELSLRAWIHTEENKRRTLQRNDIATAITKFDQFDFLIDIVPREELKPTRRPEEGRAGSDNVQYFYTLPQQPQNAQTATLVGQSQTPSSSNTLQTGQQQIVLSQPGSQVLQLSQNGQILSADGNQQIIQIPQQNQQSGGTIVIGGNNQSGGIVLNAQESQQTQALLQQIVGNTNTPAGEVHSIQISPDGQLQLVKMPPTAEATQEQTCKHLQHVHCLRGI